MTASKKSLKRKPNLLGKKLEDAAIRHLGEQVYARLSEKPDEIRSAPPQTVRYRDLHTYVIGTDEVRLEDVEFFKHFTVGTACEPYSHFAKFTDEGAVLAVYPTVE